MRACDLSRLGFAALLIERAEVSRRLSEIDVALASAYTHVGIADDFTSTRLPPRVSRRAFRERCATIATARREGKLWIVSRADWFASFRRPSRALVVAPAAPANDEVDVDAMLAAAGLRTTRRAS